MPSTSAGILWLEHRAFDQFNFWICSLPKLTRVFTALLIIESPLLCKAPDENKRGRLEYLDLTGSIGAEAATALRELKIETDGGVSQHLTVISGIAEHN